MYIYRQYLLLYVLIKLNNIFAIFNVYFMINNEVLSGYYYHICGEKKSM